MKTLLVMAGGTGGHIFPGLAVADAVKEAGWRVVWLGHPDGMEARLVPPRGYEMAELRFDALRGKGVLRKLLLPFNLLRGFWHALQKLGEVRPDVVIGLGGFVSFPAGMMAVLKGIPLVVHEQNSVAGLANRVLAGVADRVLTGFPAVLKNECWVGNPVRAEIAALPLPGERYGERQVLREPLHLLVVGGSLGALALNEALPAALALWPENERPQVVHQSGEKHLDALKAAYVQAGVHANCVSFIDDMAGAYAWADLVVCRAGALTIAELAAAGVASLLVPYPHAVDDHQTGNARFLAQAGAAILLPQVELTPEKLSLLQQMSRDQLLQMAEKARALARLDATTLVAKACMELAK
ncbi:MAG: undecaprenyldiphospho-muramoylpentapeptide beta-N-acetylglucosaminyltransferase [Sterolibacterium sp.]|nr:undecaprenyldiphospho-muramoylpentapeptide beta-N-acetylglucosaminyltransferase [Sterolibacterium sp.]